MKVPKYVKELLERATYNYDALKDENYSVGYTIDIKKRTHYQYISSFRAEIERLVVWVNKEFARRVNLCDDKYDESPKCAYIISIPTKTRHSYMQYATITIFDPVMKDLEKYINKEEA